MQKLVKALEGFDSVRVEKFVTRSKPLAGDGVIVNLTILRNGNNRELYTRTQYLANDRGIDEVLDMMASQAMMKLSLPLAPSKSSRPKPSTLDMDSQIDAALAAGSDESDEDLVEEDLEEGEEREIREDPLFKSFLAQTRSLSTLFGGEKGKEEFDKSLNDPTIMKHAYQRYKLEKDYFRRVRELDDLAAASETPRELGEPTPVLDSLETFSEAFQNQVRAVEESRLQSDVIFAGADEPTRNFVLKHLKDPELVKGIFDASAKISSSESMEEQLAAFMPIIQNMATKIKQDPSRPDLVKPDEEVFSDSERITPAAFARNIEEAMEKLGVEAPNTKRSEDVPQQFSDLFTAFTTPQGLSELGNMMQNPGMANLMSGMMGSLSAAFANVQPRADQRTSGKAELGSTGGLDEDLEGEEGEVDEEEASEGEISLTASSAGLPAPDSGSTRGKGLLIVGVDSPGGGTTDSFVMELPEEGEISFADFPFRKK